eukprot:TRINITY_DN8373_c0_g1_i1.p1 TRINITY_DN8373_c0_g1~~TRINITY_DN8373_c0_g1_i1.p1  ORF type:complete len:195 (+),score=70.56 TRINITY_DN8373_c0_g1_i1:44-628(+)
MNSKKKTNKIDPNGKKCCSCSNLYKKGNKRWVPSALNKPSDFVPKNKIEDGVNDIICRKCYTKFINEKTKKRKLEEKEIQSDNRFIEELEKGIEEGVKKEVGASIVAAVRRDRMRNQKKSEEVKKKHKAKVNEIVMFKDRKIEILQTKLKKEKMGADKMIQEKDEEVNQLKERLKERDEIIKEMQERINELERN